MIVKRFNGIKGGSTFFSFLKWANSGLFLFIFVLFKHNFTEKTVGFSGIRTRVVRVEGEQADYLTTIRALKFVYHIVTNSLSGTCLPLQCSCRRLVFIASAQRSKNCFKRNVFLIGIQSYSHF